MKRSRLKFILILAAIVGALGIGFATYRSRRPSLPHDQAYALGMKNLEAGGYKDAYGQLSHAARVHPEDPRYHWGAAQAALRLGNPRTAASHAHEAWMRGLKNKDVFLVRLSETTGDRRSRLEQGLGWVRELPDTPERRELEGDLMQAAGEHADALRAWTDLYATHPAPGLANKIALARVGMGQPEAAHELLKSCRSQGRLDEEGYGLLASLAAYRDDADDATAVFAEGRTRHEASESLRLNEAVFLIWRDRLAEAAALLEPLKEKSAEPAKAALRSQARIFLGLLRGAQGDASALDALTALAAGDGPALEGERLFYQGLREKSAETLAKARLLVKSHPALDWALAREQARRGAWKESADAYQGVAGLIARAPVLQIEFAFALARSGKLDEAYAALHRLHARRFFAKASLELLRDIASAKGLVKEAAEAQGQLQKRFGDDPSVALAGGVLALRSGHLSEAAAILDALAGRNPEREDVELARLSVLFARKDYEGVLKAAAASRASAAALAPIQAAALVMLKRDDDACALYEKILAGRREPLTLLSFANLLLRMDKTDRAAELYGETLKLEPHHPVALLGLANAALRRGDWKGARAKVEAAAAPAPSIAYAHLLLAEIEIQEGRPDRAMTLCARALGIDPKDERAMFLLGVATLDLGRYDEAEGLLSRCAAARPDAAHYQWQLARVRLSRGAFGEALAVVDGALARRLPDEASFQAMKMVLLARMSRPGEARELLSRLAPNMAPERVVLCDGWLLLQEGKREEAAARFRERLQDPHVAFAWAELLLTDGQPEGVIEALDRHPLDAARWGRLAELARQKDRMAAAVACYSRALRTDPENPQILNNYAYASLLIETFDEASVLAAAKKACAAMPGNASVVHTYATALLRCRKERECLELLDKSPALTQKSARLLLAQAQAHERLQHWKLSLQSYAACLAHPDTEGVPSGDLSRETLRRQVDLMKSKSEAR